MKPAIDRIVSRLAEAQPQRVVSTVVGEVDQVSPQSRGAGE
jgi:hypothetical protein